MDRRLILAVAGSGKTTTLINKLDENRRSLIVTYTDNNLKNLTSCVIHKFGYVPDNIILLTYFQFLFRVCYQPFFKEKINASGISWKIPDAKSLKISRLKDAFYLTKSRYLYYNRIAKLCQRNINDIKARIEKYYDCFMFDEVQDLAGHDFDLIRRILPQTIDCLFVGDFFQHTFDTSLDGNLHKGLYNDLKKYIKEWCPTGLVIDATTLSKSHRCSPTVCKYVKDELGIDMESSRTDNTQICIIDKQIVADELFLDQTKVKLFFKESYKYPCNGINWGNSKGLNDFQDICIILNATTFKAFKKNGLKTLSPSTRNKLYVACTRARGNIYFIPHTFVDKYKQV